MRAILKTGTRQIHEQVDDAFSTLDLADYHDYSVFLNAHFRAYSTLCHHHPDQTPLGDALRDLRCLLARDLQSLGAANTIVQTQKMPSTLHPLGIGYVIGGSHFGKRVLQKRWSKSTDTRVLHAGRYLDTHLLKELWMTMLVALNAEQNEVPAIIESATATFALFFKSLTDAKAASTKHLEPTGNQAA